MRPAAIAASARGKQGDWEAICVDLDVAVQGGSFSQVQDALKAAVIDYVAAAKAEQDDSQRQLLLARAAPLSVMLLWSIRLLISAWRHRGGFDEGVSTASFPIAAAA
jgi:hypothetical protein